MTLLGSIRGVPDNPLFVMVRWRRDVLVASIPAVGVVWFSITWAIVGPSAYDLALVTRGCVFACCVLIPAICGVLVSVRIGDLRRRGVWDDLWITRLSAQELIVGGTTPTVFSVGRLALAPTLAVCVASAAAVSMRQGGWRRSDSGCGSGRCWHWSPRRALV